jgi:hypothetical protein
MLYGEMIFEKTKNQAIFSWHSLRLMYPQTKISKFFIVWSILPILFHSATYLYAHWQPGGEESATDDE